MRVVITGPAESDLENIFDFIAADNVQAAIDYVRHLRTTALGLGNFPRRYRLRRDLGADIRTVPVGSHIIAYHIRRNRVEVLRFPHGAMDLTRIFGAK